MTQSQMKTQNFKDEAHYVAQLNADNEAKRENRASRKALVITCISTGAFIFLVNTSFHVWSVYQKEKIEESMKKALVEENLKQLQIIQTVLDTGVKNDSNLRSLPKNSFKP